MPRKPLRLASGRFDLWDAQLIFPLDNQPTSRLRFSHMKKIIRYEHKCKRCENTFVSRMQKPKWCGKCKSASWDVKPQPKPVAQDSAAA